jgi:hypothetical protein
MILLMESLLTDAAELRLGLNAGPRISREDPLSHPDLPLATEDRDGQARIEATNGDP